MNRKDFLKKSALTCAGLGLAASLPGCSLFDEAEMLVGNINEIKEAGIFTSKFNRKQILVTFLDEDLVIFSLVCTHKRCTVEYEAENESFLCPCHDGIYNKEGKVVDGPPPRPLNRFKYEIRGEELWVQNEYII